VSSTEPSILRDSAHAALSRINPDCRLALEYRTEPVHEIVISSPANTLRMELRKVRGRVNTPMEIFKEFSIERPSAAQRARSHNAPAAWSFVPDQRLRRCPIQPDSGWVMDFADIKKPHVHSRELDHRYLNDVPA